MSNLVGGKEQKFKRDKKTESNESERESGRHVGTVYSIRRATRNGGIVTLGIDVRDDRKQKYYSTLQLAGIHGTNGRTVGGGQVAQSRLP